MPTEKQIAASRANGAHSKGPVSVQGKLNSSRNSLRHGLLARTIVLEEESTDRFRELLNSLIDEFHPASPTQLMLVETMAAARWRQLRIWGLQKVALDREIAIQDPALGPAEVRAALAFGNPAETPRLELLLRYETAADRQFNRALKQLLALQSKPAIDGAQESDSQQRTPQNRRPEGERSDLPVLRAPKGVHSREFAAKVVFPERTQQPLERPVPIPPTGPKPAPPGEPTSSSLG